VIWVVAPRVAAEAEVGVSDQLKNQDELREKELRWVVRSEAFVVVWPVVAEAFP